MKPQATAALHAERQQEPGRDGHLPLRRSSPLAEGWHPKFLPDRAAQT
jgi:hypothetical protein